MDAVPSSAVLDSLPCIAHGALTNAQMIQTGLPAARPVALLDGQAKLQHSLAFHLISAFWQHLWLLRICARFASLGRFQDALASRLISAFW